MKKQSPLLNSRLHRTNNIASPFNLESFLKIFTKTCQDINKNSLEEETDSFE